MEYEEILHRCFRCGYCKLPESYQDLNCPSYLRYRFETFAPGGRMWLLRAWLDGEIQSSPRMQQILFSCAACANCVEHCVFPKFKSDLLNAFTSGRSELVNQGAVPAVVARYLKAVHMYGNPYRLPEEERGAWAEGLNLEEYCGQEYLFFVGCAGSYDDRGRKMARAAAGLIREMGVSMGILGARERCDGNETRMLGESMLFEELARRNVKLFDELGVKRIITLSPHAYNAMKNEYPGFGGNYQVLHYSQLLAGLMDKTAPADAGAPCKVTFHDPCYLGRHNMDYLSPRVVIASLPGVELVEMDRTGKDALCCGGGGGNFFTDLLGGSPDSPSRVRAREAAETGARVLVVACPKCAKMLEDGVTAENLEDRLEVMDLAELVNACRASSCLAGRQTAVRE